MAAQEISAGGGPQEMRMRYGADVSDSNFVVHGKAVPLLAGLLCALIFFVALCLYLRWRCGRYTRHTPEDPENASSSSAPDSAPPLPGLDDDAIRALPVTLYRSAPASPARVVVPGKEGSGGEKQADDDDREAMCSICIGALEAGEKVKVLPPCGHCFHPECVDFWLRKHPSCPLCRCLLIAAKAKPEVVNGTDEAV